MKTIPAPLLTHYGQPATSLATLIRVTRRDGAVYGFTTHDRDILSDNVLHSAATALAPSQINSSSDFSVDNLEALGSLTGSAINADDLEAGLWDGASVRVSVVNWTDLSQGEDIMRVGELGQVRLRGNEFVAELRGLMDRLQKAIHRTYLQACDADLGDTRCGVSMVSFTFTGTVTAVVDAGAFTAGSLAQAADYFTYGTVLWTSGANNGRSMEIKRHQAGGVISLLLAMPRTVAVGDTFTITAGCDKSFGTCQSKFSNVVRFRGFPHLPGVDKVLQVGGVK
ncbi:MAG: DUF2163 domain-containing protein [Pseudomonadota bacterium]|jgi:uncharacterized phage protein (TIGR02218 family)